MNVSVNNIHWKFQLINRTFLILLANHVKTKVGFFMAVYLPDPNFPYYCRGYEYFDSVMLLGADLAMLPSQR